MLDEFVPVSRRWQRLRKRDIQSKHILNKFKKLISKNLVKTNFKGPTHLFHIIS